ncbi:MAG TPA: bifunctional 4-hydroxy-2-oxoglutarate aldolase/2-dehydro-3-deoxy-phosphogluconate aldolase [Planosporangium sp.]|jgi:2-dehydro-3-deoxyphosphogluconate aldolase/(4S)-4-hydroxy-2-oxoglutarate aldolase|nr:bifunctional 4-hydroxy-2-oxoglutarate aldolase/2-dehydro-3-deoxy-phosphogluconate aldolase [Planosporangium sp.]
MSMLDDMLDGVRVMVILRALGPEKTVERAEAAWAAGVPLVEVTIGAAEDVKSLRAAVEAGRDRGFRVVAGTVVTLESVRIAADAGAAFTVAPGFDPDIVVASADVGLPHVPGVATPSEVQRATQLGCRWLKAFPAVSLGPQWFSAIRGPFPGVRFVATGGLDPTNAPAFLDAGAAAVGLGSVGDDPAALAALVSAAGGWPAR